jgi:hypothetical protein
MHGVLTAVLLKAKSFGTWHHVIWQVVSKTLKNLGVLTFGVKYSWYAWSKRWRQYNPSKCHKLFTQWQSVTSQKTWIKYSYVLQVLVLYCLEECKYSKTSILYCCILGFCNLFTSCIVLAKCPKEQCFPDFMLSQIICQFRWHIQKHKIGVLLYF